MSAKLPSCLVVSRYTAPAPEKEARRRGRPLIRTADHYAALIDDFQRMAAWFLKTHQRPHRSDIELITCFISESLAQDGKRRSRVAGAEWAGRIKTMRNELSRARKWHRQAGNSSQQMAF